MGFITAPFSLWENSIKLKIAYLSQVKMDSAWLVVFVKTKIIGATGGASCIV